MTGLNVDVAARLCPSGGTGEGVSIVDGLADATRLDSGMDVVLHINGVVFESVQSARLLVYPRGHRISAASCGRAPLVSRHVCSIPLLVAVDQRVFVVKCADVPLLADGRYEGLVQVLARPGWLDVGSVFLLEYGDVELL